MGKFIDLTGQREPGNVAWLSKKDHVAAHVALGTWANNGHGRAA